MKKEELEKTVKEILEHLTVLNEDDTIPVGVSIHHIHISREHLDKLFGIGYELHSRNPLTQPGQYASEECVTLVGPKRKLENVRILGPIRKETQIEISITDGYYLGIVPPIRDSGQLENTPSIKIIGPKGEIITEKGLIVAKRHIHLTPQDAKKFNVEDKEIVRVIPVSKTERTLIFDEVLIRINPNYALDFHIDPDETNAASLKNGDKVFLIKKSDEEINYHKLVTENIIKEALRLKQKIYITKETIITPQAKDLLRKHPILVELKK